MRNLSTLVQQVSETIKREAPNALFLAIGGSHGVARQDEQSDLDLIVLFAEGPLVAQSAALMRVLLPVIEEPCSLVGGPTWKEGFGCRTTVLLGDGFKIEVFGVTADTVPVVDRVLHWKPVWGSDSLSAVQQSVRVLLTFERALSKARFDTTYMHLSVCRHLARGELFAARHVLVGLAAVALALRLLELEHPYDPITSYKRIARAGLAADPAVRRIEGASALLGGGAEELRRCLAAFTETCFEILDTLGGLSEQAFRARKQMSAITSAGERWIAA